MQNAPFIFDLRGDTQTLTVGRSTTAVKVKIKAAKMVPRKIPQYKYPSLSHRSHTGEYSKP